MNEPPIQQRLNDAAGVSAIEALIVLAMVCVIAGFVCFKLIQGNHATYRQTTAIDFANYLRKARLDSLRRQVKDISQMAQVKVFNRRSYSIAIDGDGDGQLDIPLVMSLPDEQGVEMNGPFPKVFIFDGLGQTVDALNRRIAAEPVTLTNSSGASAVTLSETGEVIVVPAMKLTASK